jgi:hypothetical protein
MSPNIVTTLTCPVPRIDTGALIDRAFASEPVRLAARAVVMQLQAVGETVQYADSRTGNAPTSDKVGVG